MSDIDIESLIKGDRVSFKTLSYSCYLKYENSTKTLELGVHFDRYSTYAIVSASELEIRNDLDKLYTELVDRIADRIKVGFTFK